MFHTKQHARMGIVCRLYDKIVNFKEKAERMLRQAGVIIGFSIYEVSMTGFQQMNFICSYGNRSILNYIRITNKIYFLEQY